MCHKRWTTTQYFKLERGARQVDQISAYFFILTLGILFLLIKKHPEIKVIDKFEHCFLYAAYADNTTIFLKVSVFSGLKPNLTKCEIVRIGALKGVQLAVCGMKRIDLCYETIKILGTYFSYINTIKEESNFLKVVSNVQTVLKLWQFRNLTLEERIVVFKSLAISKIVFQALIATVPSHIIKHLETI